MEKMLVSVFVLGLVAMVTADCGAMERLKVKQQWAEVYGDGNERVSFGEAVWKGIFHREPATRSLFTRVNGENVHSPEFRAHSSRVLGGLDMCVSLLDDEATLNAQLAHLNGQHKERGIPANYFKILGEVLMEVVPAKLGRCFDHDAWESCYGVIADGISK